MARYVGFKIGKVHEEHVFSEYYCGGCGFPVTDHDSFCPECGGAFRESDADDENAKLREMAAQALQIIKHVNVVMAIDYARYGALMGMARELGIEVDE